MGFVAFDRNFFAAELAKEKEMVNALWGAGSFLKAWGISFYIEL